MSHSYIGSFKYFFCKGKWTGFLFMCNSISFCYRIKQNQNSKCKMSKFLDQKQHSRLEQFARRKKRQRRSWKKKRGPPLSFPFILPSGSSFHGYVEKFSQHYTFHFYFAFPYKTKAMNFTSKESQFTYLYNKIIQRILLPVDDLLRIKN